MHDISVVATKSNLPSFWINILAQGRKSNILILDAFIKSRMIPLNLTNI